MTNNTADVYITDEHDKQVINIINAGVIAHYKELGYATIFKDHQSRNQFDIDLLEIKIVLAKSDGQ